MIIINTMSIITDRSLFRLLIIFFIFVATNIIIMMVFNKVFLRQTILIATKFWYIILIISIYIVMMKILQLAKIIIFNYIFYVLIQYILSFIFLIILYIFGTGIPILFFQHALALNLGCPYSLFKLIFIIFLNTLIFLV